MCENMYPSKKDYDENYKCMMHAGVYDLTLKELCGQSKYDDPKERLKCYQGKEV